MRILLFFAASIVAVLLSGQLFSCSNRAASSPTPVIVQGSPDKDGLIRIDKSDLERFRGVWLAHKKAAYEFTLATENAGFSSIPTVRISVKNNEVDSIHLANDRDSTVPDLYKGVNTIDRIFDVLSKEVETSEVKVRFNEEYGYPLTIGVNEKGREHGWYKLTISDFRFLE